MTSRTTIIRNALIGAAGLVALSLPAHAATSTVTGDQMSAPLTAKHLQLAQRNENPGGAGFRNENPGGAGFRNENPGGAGLKKKAKKKGKK